MPAPDPELEERLAGLVALGPVLHPSVLRERRTRAGSTHVAAPLARAAVGWFGFSGGRLGVAAAFDGAGADDLRPPEPLDLLLLDDLGREQARRHHVELVPVGAHELAGALLRVEDERLDLPVHLERGLVRVGARLEPLHPEEPGPVLVAERDRAERRAHAVVAHHHPREGGRVLQVVRGAGGGLAEDLLLGDAAAHEAGHPVAQLAPGEQVAVLDRQLQRVAERPDARAG